MSYELFHDDCFNVFPRLPDNSVDLVLCDPPYGTTKCRWDTPLDLERMWEQIKRIRKPGAPVLLFAQTPFDKVLGSSNLKELRYEWIWEKNQSTGFLNANKMPLKAHENILTFYDRLPYYKPFKTKGAKLKRSTRSDVNSKIYGKALKYTAYESDERYPRSVLRFPTDKHTLNLHPTQKPEALLSYFIETYTLPGATVFDFTMGSGSTGASSIACGRHFVGIEKPTEEGYFYTAEERIERLYYGIGEDLGL